MKLHSWDELKTRKLGTAGVERVRGRVERELFEANLAALRQALGVTQVEAAQAAEMSQSELSRVERREDHLVSTLRQYVRALGGELEVTAVFPEKRVKLTGV